MLAVWATAWAPDASARQTPKDSAAAERAATRDGRRLAGHLESRGGGRAWFVPADAGIEPLPLEDLADVRFEPPSPGHAWSDPPFQLLLAGDGRLAGRLEAVDDKEIRLEEGPDGGPVRVARAGVRALIQRPGEALILLDEFETLNESHWARNGSPAIVEEPRLQGRRSLRLMAGGMSLAHRLDEPLVAGRLEVAFHDPGGLVTGHQVSVLLTFREGRSTPHIRVVLGFDASTLSVESPGGPLLAVQRLERRAAWHQLAIRFGPEGTQVLVDGAELAHGDAPRGPLVECVLASKSSGAAAAPHDLAMCFDDFRLSQRAEPQSSLEIEPSLDEVRLASGDQLFGHIVGADRDKVRLTLGADASLTHLDWANVTGLYFRRVPEPAATIAGTWIRLEWQSGSTIRSRQLDRLEGAIREWRPDGARIEVPYLGAIEIPRPCIRRIEVLNRCLRKVLDPGPYHLGDRVSPELDPPFPDGSILDRRYRLEDLPEGRASFVVDVVGVVGVEGTPGFSEVAKRGELRTRIQLNGKWLEDLNTFVTTPNERPERIRIPLPPELLKRDENVLRIEQTGTRDDPGRRDNLGLANLALEWPTPPVPRTEGVERSRPECP
jgi:hypothetical protein